MTLSIKTGASGVRDSSRPADPAPQQPEDRAGGPLLNGFPVAARLRWMLGLAAAAPAVLAAIYFLGGADAPLVMLAATLLIVIVALLMGAWLARSIAEPVEAVSRAMAAAAAGRDAMQIPALDHGDETGEMARALKALRDSPRLEPDEPAGGAPPDRAAMAVHGLAAAFADAVEESLASLSGTAVALRETAESMASLATRADGHATTVSAMSQETASGAQSAAATAGQMSTSIGKIEKQVMHSATIAASAVQELHETNKIIETLADAAQQIGGVVELIHQIAGQTNLLALNATIEAARAGEAGKGFAVVAQEVKILATQTAKATDGIAEQVETIQSRSRGAAEAMENVRTVIAEIFDIATDIAGAVDEQGDATKEIAGNIEQVTDGVRRIAGNMTELTGSAEQADRTSAELLAASETLEEHSRILRERVSNSLEAIRVV